MASKINIQDEIRRITSETANLAASKALEVAELAKQKAAEVSTLAIAEALKAATLAATKAADAASAAATIAASTSKDLEYIKKDISDTKSDVKEIKDKLDNRYVTKDDFTVVKETIANHITILHKDLVTLDMFKNMEEKVNSINSNIAWVIKIIVGIVIVALVGVVIVNK